MDETSELLLSRINTKLTTLSKQPFGKAVLHVSHSTTRKTHSGTAHCFGHPRPLPSARFVALAFRLANVCASRYYYYYYHCCCYYYCAPLLPVLEARSRSHPFALSLSLCVLLLPLLARTSRTKGTLCCVYLNNFFFFNSWREKLCSWLVPKFLHPRTCTTYTQRALSMSLSACVVSYAQTFSISGTNIRRALAKTSELRKKNTRCTLVRFAFVSIYGLFFCCFLNKDREDALDALMLCGVCVCFLFLLHSTTRRNVARTPVPNNAH